MGTWPEANYELH